MLRKIAQFWSDEDGISSVEYALLLAFIGAGVAGAAFALGGAVTDEMEEAETAITTPPA